MFFWITFLNKLTALGYTFKDNFLKKQWAYWYLPLTILALLTCFLQTQGLLNDDVINGIHLAKQMLAGGNYVTDFFENNPPLILYLYSPPILLAKVTTLNIHLGMPLYFTLLIVGSLLLSHRMLTTFFGENSGFNYLVSYIAAYVLLLLPAYQFGQREHLVVVFTLPYLIAAALRLKNKLIPPGFAIVIGVAAGIGFSIKPFFLITPIFIELFLMVATKNWAAWFRTETLIALFITISYLAWVWFAYPAYSHIVAPLALQFYYPSQKQSWAIIFHYNTVLFSLAVAIFYLLAAKNDRYPQLGRLLFLGLLGFIAAFIIPRNAWGYHTLPAVSMAYFLLAFLFSQIILELAGKATGVDSDLKVKAAGRTHEPAPTNAVIQIDKSAGAGRVPRILLLSIIGLIFILPLLKSFLDIMESIEKRSRLNSAQLITFFNKQQTASTFTCLSLGFLTYQPLTHYSKARFVGKFSSLWWEIGYHVLLHHSTNEAALKQLQNRRKLLIDALAIDISAQKPHFILVDVTPYRVGFDFLPELLTYPSFNKVWKNYHYVNTFELNSMNRAIYQVFIRAQEAA